MIKKVTVHLVFLVTVLLLTPHPGWPSQEAAYRYNEEGVKRLKAHDYKGAIVAFKQARAYEPANKSISKNLGIAYNNYGFDLMKKGELKSAIEKFEYALNFNPDSALTLYNLGQSYYRIQNMPKAREYLTKAYNLEPSIKGLKGLLKKAKNESGVEREFEKTETMHFIIASSPDIPASNLSYIRTYLEEAYGRVGMLLDYYPKDKVIAILYSEGNYDKLVKNKPHWTMAFFDGKLRMPVSRSKYSTDDVIQIVYHEYAHAVIYDMGGESVPLWLSEGIASKAEEFVAPKKREQFKAYIERYGLSPINEIPESFASIQDRDIATLMYMESYLLVDFIVSRAGQEGLRDMLGDLKRGGTIDNSLEKLFSESIETFEEKWKRYIIDKNGLRSIEAR